MEKILVTGGAGFIGSHLVNKLIDNNFIVHVCDNLITGKKEFLNLNPNCFFHKIDVNEFSKISTLMYKENFKYVFHYAAIVGVQRTLDNPIDVLKDVEGLKNIFSLSAETKVKRIFFSSSSEVYGEPVHLPQNEESTPLNSKLPYAVVKNLGECFCKSYKSKFDLDYNILRFFNTYGKNQSSDFVVSKFVNWAKKNEDIKVYGKGSQTRTFCFIEDNVDTTINILNENKYINNVINIGHEKEYTILELAKLVIKILNSKSKIKFLDPLEEGDMTRRQPDISKMKKILKRNLISLEEGINIYIKK